MSSLCDYYSEFRKNNPITAEIIRIEDSKLKNVLLVFNDNEVAVTLPENIGNYYAWMAIEIKKHIKNKYQISGLVKCIFYSNYKEQNEKKQASIVINCDTDSDLDAPLFQ